MTTQILTSRAAARELRKSDKHAMTRVPQIPSVARCVAAFGCTPEQAARLLARNAIALGSMAAKAERTRKPVNGYSANELRQSQADYSAASRNF